jgi:serine protease Do
MKFGLSYIKHHGVLFLYLVVFSFNANARTLPDFIPLVEDNAAAVVNISTTLKKSELGGKGPHGFKMPDIPENSPFYEFFKKFFGEIPEGMAPFEHRSSLGSGFIISRDGFVITNNHVVKEADEIIVRLNDRREFIAELIGTDERSDIAVLKVDATELPSVKLGNSTNLKVGEWVLAIGSPFGFDHSVTAGIISAMGRSLPNENYIPFIQTDVAINPGNSGGPLFNLKGEVIGVNSQIYSRTGGFMGLSFAVPINVVTNVYQQLRDQGHVSRGWLGVLIQDVTRELAESFGMERPHGALIAKVLPDSPAAAAGLEVGDVVIRFDGDEVSFSSDLPPMVGNSIIGNAVPVDIIRRGKNRRWMPKG